MNVNGAASTGAAQETSALPQGNGEASAAEQPQLDPQMVERIMALRSRMHAVFAQVTMATMSTPRTRHHTLAELQHRVLEPMIRFPPAVATPPHKESCSEPPPAGVAIWAKVPDEVDAKIREQIKSGAFPAPLKALGWDTGGIAWLLDVVAPRREQGTAVGKNFGQVVKDGKLFVHPGVALKTGVEKEQ